MLLKREGALKCLAINHQKDCHFCSITVVQPVFWPLFLSFLGLRGIMNPYSEFTCLYTSQKQKKAKTWQDGNGQGRGET